jgi:NitT/TauT family transport system substrate-binding protein
MTRRVRALVAAGLLAALNPVQIAGAAEKIVLLHTGSAPYMASFVAKDQGFFEKRGLDVELTLAANGSVIIAATTSGAAQIGTPTPTVLLQAVDNGIDQVVLAATNQYPETIKTGLVARPEANIRGAADLAGKKVGVPGIGGFLDVVLRRWIKENGADPAKVNYVEIILPQTGDALKAGTVDAVASVDPFVSRAVDSKSGVLVADYTASLPTGTIASIYSASGDWANSHRDAVKAFQEAIVEANAFARANPAAARESLARHTKLPPPVVNALPIPNLAARTTPEQIAFWIGVAKDQKMISGSPDPAKIVFPWLAATP